MLRCFGFFLRLVPDESRVRDPQLVRVSGTVTEANPFAQRVSFDCLKLGSLPLLSFGKCQIF